MQSVPAGEDGAGTVEDLVAAAMAAAEAGDMARAEAMLAAASRRAPGHLGVLREHGRLMMRQGRFERALTPLRRVADAELDSAQAHADLGAALAALGDLNGGLDELEIALALDDANETAREGAAIVRGLLRSAGAADRAPVPQVLAPGRNVWFVGNSQLITSVLRAYCPTPAAMRIGEDWRENRVSRGNVEIDAEAGVSAYYACGNMGLLGNPAFAGGELRNADGTQAFADLVADDATDIVVMVRGNEFALESLADSDPRWDFPYGDIPAQPGRQFVAKSDVLAHFAKVTNGLLAACVVYRRRFPQARIFHVPAPPPIESEAHILANPEIFGRVFATHGIRPFAIRKKMYEAMYDQLAEALRVHDVRLIPIPESCLTEAGGLRADHAHGCLHGNDLYGRALVAALRGE